jgi:hypothetical protein
LNLLLANQNKALRAPVNQLDKTTIVSIFPREILETKHTIQPGKFFIPAGSYEKPSVLVVGSSSWWKDVGENQPLLEIPIGSITIADSIVRDYANGLFECDMGDRMPGLFYVQGNLTPLDVKKNHQGLLDQALAKQRNWYFALVKAADSFWARTNGNPQAIGDDMRLAAQELGLKDKEWLKDFSTVEMVRCIACGSLRNPNYPVCSTCKAVVDKEAAKKLDLQFVS